MIVNLGGIVHLSTVDWPGSASTVIFLRGCPLRCPHCQNRALQKGDSPADISFQDGEIKVMEVRPGRCKSSQLTMDQALELAEERAGAEKAKPFLSRLVLSGGEPLMQPDAVSALAKEARDLGLEVGIETCGFYPSELSRLIEDKKIDKIFLDVKAALRDPEYERASGRRGIAKRVLESLRISLSAGIPLEIRITIFPGIPSAAEIEELAMLFSDLKEEFPGHRLESVAIQQGQPSEGEFQPVSPEHLKGIAEVMECIAKVRIKERPEIRWGPGHKK